MNFNFMEAGGGKCLHRNERARFIAAFAAVFIWGLAAHAYGFLNFTISHDSLYELAVEHDYILRRIALGRFAAPVYQLIFHGRLALPWLNGLLTLCWLSVAVWLTARMFSIEDKLRITLLAGILTVNVTVTALIASYTHDLDTDIFGAMLSVYAAFLWHRGGRKAWFAVPLLVIVLGLYQSMLSVAVALIMFASILALLRGEKALDVIRKGLQAIAMILTAGAAYLLLVKLTCLLAGTELLDSYNGLTNLFKDRGGFWRIVWMTYDAYLLWLDIFLRSARSRSLMLLLHILLVIPVAFALIHAMGRKSLAFANKLLILVLGALMPLGMNISYLADGGMVHDLMLYAAWLTYLMVILMTDWYTASVGVEKKRSKFCCAAMLLALSLILGTCVQTANNAYLKKDMERQSALSVMTTVNRDMNETEGYAAGETEVLFVGTPQTKSNEIFPYLSEITGLGYTSQITYTRVFCSFYQYILQTPFLPCESEIPEAFTNAMPCYPETGYIRWYGDILVVKMSE